MFLDLLMDSCQNTDVMPQFYMKGQIYKEDMSFTRKAIILYRFISLIDRKVLNCFDFTNG